MPYTHYNTDERNTLQAMEGMGLPKSDMAVTLGKHPGSICRELNRNGTGAVYTGSGARALGVQRRLDSRTRPRLGNPALAQEIMRLFKEDLSPEQISGRLGVLDPEQAEMRASTSAVHTCIYGETAKDPALKERFRQKQAKPRRRKGAQDRRGQVPRGRPGRRHHRKRR